jgi:WD40 repeat protein
VVEFDPTSRWLAAPFPSRVAMWPVTRDRYPYLLRGHSGQVREFAFAPDSSWLVSSGSDGTVRWWPLTEGAGAESRVLFEWVRPWVYVGFPSLNPHFTAVAPDGSWVAVTGQEYDTVHVVPIAGGEPRVLRSDGEPLAALTVHPDGRRLAVGAGGYHQAGAIFVWDLETDEVERIEVEGHLRDLQFLPDGSLLDVMGGRVGHWDLTTGERESIDVMPGGARLHLSADGRRMLRVNFDNLEHGRTSEIVLVDLVDESIEGLSAFGGFGGWAQALSPSGRIAVVQDRDSLMVARIAGGEPHRILAETRVCAISPDEKWIATGDESGDIWLWPMPDLDRKPLESLSHDELLAKLKTMTNARAVRDDAVPDGWGIRYEQFPGWQEVPEW